MLGHCFLKYKLARDMTYSRQQLLWQKQITIIRSVKFGSYMNEYHTGVAWFQHAVSHRRSVQKQRFAPMSLLFVAQDAYSRSFNEFFIVANMSSFSSMRRIKIMSRTCLMYLTPLHTIVLPRDFWRTIKPSGDELLPLSLRDVVRGACCRLYRAMHVVLLW